jgi:hypothetical protein
MVNINNMTLKMDDNFAAGSMACVDLDGDT